MPAVTRKAQTDRVGAGYTLSWSYVHLERHTPSSAGWGYRDCVLCGKAADFRVGYLYDLAPSAEMGFELLCESCLAYAIGWLQLEIWKRKCRL